MRVFVSSVGETGTLVGRTSYGGCVVHLHGDPEHIDRTFSRFDVEPIEPYPEGHPEGERLQRAGERIVSEVLGGARGRFGEVGMYRVEHPGEDGLQDYLNRAARDGFEVVSISEFPAGRCARVVLRDARARTRERGRAHLREWVRTLPDDVNGPAGLIELTRHLVADLDALANEATAEGSGETGGGG